MSALSWSELFAGRSVYAWILTLAVISGGLWGFENIGRLEDPNYPFRYAYIITHYPGASAQEVEQQVTDRLETSLQELPQLREIFSRSLNARSEIRIEIEENYKDEELPQIWDELRRRVNEAAMQLPKGTSQPLVEDDFNDIYGELYAIDAEGFTAKEISDFSRDISIALRNVTGVAKTLVRGLPSEAIYLDIEKTKMESLGFDIANVFDAINRETRITQSGDIRVGSLKLRLARDNALNDISAFNKMTIGKAGSTELIPLSDIATVSRSALDTPVEIIRHNGKPVFLVGVSIIAGTNVVAIGENIAEKIDDIQNQLPIGVNITPIYQQHKTVESAINVFMQNLMLSIITVFVALCIFMGWRAGSVVGIVLVLTILSTLWVMALAGIELQRISLGALMIAMGMLVDNAIVVAEGMVVGVASGKTPSYAAKNIVKRTQYTLLGATIIGIMAFAPIGLSNDSSGHFLRSLFYVVAISLVFSWFLAVSLVPFFGKKLLKNTTNSNNSSQHSNRSYLAYRRLLKRCLNAPWRASIAIGVITVSSIWGFQFVKQSFFPSTNTPIFFVDVSHQQGTDIRQTDIAAIDINRQLREHSDISSVTSYSGNGGVRFTATTNPDQANAAYSHFFINATALDKLESTMKWVEKTIATQYPDAEILVTRQSFSPSGKSRIEARFSGPDPHVLRSLSAQAQDIFDRHQLKNIRTDWRNQSIELSPNISETKLRIAGLTRDDIYATLQFSNTGVTIGSFSDQDKSLPIIARAASAERDSINALNNLNIWSRSQQQYIPIAQLVAGFTPTADNSILNRRNRVLTIAAQANEPPGTNVNAVFSRIKPQLEAIPLPLGYSVDWGGEYESSERARTRLGETIPPALGIMILLTILLFGTLRQPFIIWVTVPMTICGVMVALLVSDMPLTFIAFLGLLSLSGMLIKNGMVLVDEIDQQAQEAPLSVALICDACVSRFRPVLLAAGTTIAGMIPLLSDAFFREMAVCIMGGLAFGTLLTLIAIPVFYRLAFAKEIAAHAV